MKVSACLVTRGDHEDEVDEIIARLPDEWEVILWDNGAEACYRYPPPNTYWDAADLSVYGRYAAIEYATGDLIYVQDDDVICSDPEAIVDAYRRVAQGTWTIKDGPNPESVVCNMPHEFRHDFYVDHALVGFGACFHRDAPQRAFERFRRAALAPSIDDWTEHDGWIDGTFARCCDMVFTALTPRVLVDVPKENLPYATDNTRMYRQADHVAERKRMLELALKVRDA